MDELKRNNAQNDDEMEIDLVLLVLSLIHI